MSLSRVRLEKKGPVLEQLTEATLEEWEVLDKAFFQTQIDFCGMVKNLRGIDPVKYMRGTRTTTSMEFPMENYFLIKVGEETVGYVEYNLGELDSSISSLYVKEEHRGKGYGGWCINYIKDQAKEKKIKIIHIGGYATNKAAIKLYEKLGFDIYHVAMVARL